ncbi:MAG: RNA polymerase sigma factor [Flammeovirgaceae bacterium]
MTDQEIIEGCRKGKRKAQEALYSKYAHKLMGICRRYSKNYQEAEDVFQEGFVRVFKSVGKLEKTGALEAWLKRVFINTAINYYQKHKKHHDHVDYDLVYNSNDDYEHIISNLNNQELLKFVNNLPDGYRMVFNLYAIEGYTHKEIAATLGVTEGTSKSQLSKAKAMLKKRLGEFMEQEALRLKTG